MNRDEKKFRLPRKIKKSLKPTVWFFPADKNGFSLPIFPTRDQRSYAYVKNGGATNLLKPKNAVAIGKAYWEKLDKAVTVSDDTLKTYVDATFAEEFRKSAYKTLIAAKDNPKAIEAYYNFVNAYQSDMGNTCCLAVDYAKDLLKTPLNMKKRKKKK